jgi:hypothetical protein
VTKLASSAVRSAIAVTQRSAWLPSLPPSVFVGPRARNDARQRRAPLGVLFAVATLGERLTSLQWVGVALAVAAPTLLEASSLLRRAARDEAGFELATYRASRLPDRTYETWNAFRMRLTRSDSDHVE